jgi:RNA polymerase sigma-70 factor (ECF subfamily)
MDAGLLTARGWSVSGKTTSCRSATTGNSLGYVRTGSAIASEFTQLVNTPCIAGVLRSGSGVTDDLAHVVEAARDGDRSAFGELYGRFARMVHGVLLARGPRADVDDLVQDVFVIALERLHTLRDAPAFAGWLAAIARNRAADQLRRGATRTVELTDDFGRMDPDRTEALAVLGVIRTLPEAYRETLVLRLVEGMTGPEIAARTGLTAASVRVNLHRGMKQLRERLGVLV